MTTSLAYEELLAFEGLQDAVDQLYRAYLDTSIVEAKRTYKSDRHGYWKGVREFRKSELEPATPDEYPEKAPRLEQDAEADKELEAERAKHTERAAFRYWFDVRAKFWWSVADTTFAFEEFPYADELLLLSTQATALKARLERLEKIYEKLGKVGRKPAPDSRVLEKLRRQVENATRYTALAERVMSAKPDKLAQLVKQYDQRALAKQKAKAETPK